MKESLYVCVHVPEFPAQALLRLRPERLNSAAAIVDGDPPLEQVCSANVQAFRLGVLEGMTRSELEMFTGLAVLNRSVAEERIARSVLLEAAARFTPRVEIQRSVESSGSTDSSFAMVLDMTGTERIFGAVPQSVGTIAHAMAELRFFVQLAASANYHAAMCIAPAARKGPIVVPAGHEQRHLARLPLAVLNLTATQAETLALWGLHTLGELAALPEVDLVARLGQEGKRLRLLARGEQTHLMVPEEQVFALEELVAFDTPIELLDSLLFVVGPMLDQLLARAQNRCYALASVTIKLGLDGGGQHERNIQPALPMVQREVLLKLLHLDLQAHPPAAGVVSVFLHAEPGDRSKVQLGLFAPQLPEPMRLDVTLARIAALVGEERVGRAVLIDRHRPDSFKMERFTVPRPASNDAKTTHAVALRRYRPPLHLSVRPGVRCPASFLFKSKQYTVQQAFGPWRKSGDWWTSEVWSCEEWDIQAASSPDDIVLCRIVHDLLRNVWQLEALYD